MQVNRNAQFESAVYRFDNGDSTKQLYDEFVSLADAGHDEANYFLGCINEEGSNGVSKNLEHAFFYYQRSVETIGYVEGCLSAARLKYQFDEVGKDYEYAFKHYQLVADHIVAMFMLGRMYQYGQGAKKDVAMARMWYQKSIDKGSVYGMINLAILEAEEGNWLKSKLLRLRAGLNAIRISLKSRRDIRLRGA
jgi:TPR repeat protein